MSTSQSISDDGCIVFKNVADDGTVLGVARFVHWKRDGKWKKYNETTGKLTLLSTYKDDKLNGPWTLFRDDGTLYQHGYYKDDKKDGEWKQFFSNGKLENHGYFKADKRDGKWTHFNSDGTVRSIILYVDGKVNAFDTPDGVGKLFYIDGWKN